MRIKHNQYLQKYHSLSLPIKAKTVIILKTKKDIDEFVKKSDNFYPRIILGRGTNSVFLSDYQGSIIINRFAGIYFKSIDSEKIGVRINAGESWNKFAWQSVNQGLWGAENLVDIPGSIGAAIVQNIGAYGQEIKNIINWVEYINLKTRTKHRLSNSECDFGYRSSIFKNSNKLTAGDFLITRVELILSRRPQPIINYPDLQYSFVNANTNLLSPITIANQVKHIRYHKLPDPKKLKNPGSFFKNLVVDEKKIKGLIDKHPNIPYYENNQKTSPSYKIPTAWLIENVGLKGYRYGAAQISSEHALIIGINNPKKTTAPTDLIHLVRYIQNQVYQHFQLTLEPEVQIYN